VTTHTIDLVAPGDPGYDDARAVWNRLHDRRPALIARVSSPAAGVAAAAIAYVKAGFAHTLNAHLIDALIEQGGKVESPLSVIEVLAMGGAIRRTDAGAFAYRDANWLINIPGQWRDPADTPAEIAWVRDTYAASAERLREVKRAYDPENVFRLNQNIAP
jgi:hypothetical protein